MLPPVQVRQTLEAARRAGVPFGVAWHTALAKVADERWGEALAQTSNTWRRAYQLEPPTGRDVAIDMLSRGLAGELANLDGLARCPVCDHPIRPVLRGQARCTAGRGAGRSRRAGVICWTWRPDRAYTRAPRKAGPQATTTPRPPAQEG